MAAQTDTRFTLFIVDVSTEKQPIKPPPELNVTVIPAPNRGYAHSVNLGLKQARNHFSQFCVINPDTVLSQNFVAKVKTSLSAHPGAIIGGKIYYAIGYEYHRDRYRPADQGKVIWYAGGTIDWNHALTPHRGVDTVDRGQFDRFEPTGFVNGCLMCLDQSVINTVGYWDESYFLYFEDSDYCERAKRKGVKLYYDPAIVIWHKNSQSTGGSGSTIHQKYQARNRLIFALKYAPLKTKLHLIRNLIWHR